MDKGASITTAKKNFHGFANGNPIERPETKHRLQQISTPWRHRCRTGILFPSRLLVGGHGAMQLNPEKPVQIRNQNNSNWYHCCVGWQVGFEIILDRSMNFRDLLKTFKQEGR